jgi:hypothetical protein
MGFPKTRQIIFLWATPTELRLRDILTPSFTGGYAQATPMEFKIVHTTILFVRTTILFAQLYYSHNYTFTQLYYSHNYTIRTTILFVLTIGIGAM